MSLLRASTNSAEDCASKSALAPFAFDLLTNWRRARDKLQTELGRLPDATELITCEELARKQLTIFRKVLQASEKRPGELPGRSLKDTLTCSMKDTMRALKTLAQYSPIQILDLLATLEKQDQLILTLRFGLLGEAPMTFVEIGDQLDLNCQAVLQHERKALEFLRGTDNVN